jgi:hypothetical protein
VWEAISESINNWRQYDPYEKNDDPPMSIAKSRMEAGVKVPAAYPVNPSTEILESRLIYLKYTPNGPPNRK